MASLMDYLKPTPKDEKNQTKVPSLAEDLQSKQKAIKDITQPKPTIPPKK